MAKRKAKSIKKKMIADTCNLCEFVGKFNDYRGRKEVECPNCGSLERQRFLYLEMKQFITPEARILHFSPNKGLKKTLQAAQTKVYITVDKEAGETMQADIQSLPFDDNSFDVIICSHILEHIPDDEKAVAELRRVLSEKGHIFIQVPLFHDNQPDHVRSYDIKSISELLGKDHSIVTCEAPLNTEFRFDERSNKIFIITKND